MFWRKRAADRLETGVRPAPDSPAVPVPLFAASQYVTIVSGGGRPSVLPSRIHDPVSCSSPAGEGVCFLLESYEGVSGKFYFFRGFASAWPDGEATPRPQIPTKMIAAQVLDYAEALHSLFITVPRGKGRIAG